MQTTNYFEQFSSFCLFRSLFVAFANEKLSSTLQYHCPVNNGSNRIICFHVLLLCKNGEVQL